MKKRVHFISSFCSIFFFAALLLCSPSKGLAQNRTVTGSVVNDSTGEPVANASVRVKGTTAGSTTDAKGTFTIQAAPNAVLEVSSVGYKRLEVAAGATPLQIRLVVDNQVLNDVVVVGYGSRKRSDITGSVTSVPKERLSQLPVTNVLQAIQGSVPGVTITQSSSVPGSTPGVIVRGVNSISNSTTPFIVVDGIPFPPNASLNDINTADIASIEILKDPSAVAIYGTRGANGVILVTTKRGRSGKPAIGYNVYSGIEDFAKTVRPMSPEQYVQKYADWKAQSGSTDPSAVPNAYEKANFAAGITTDWLKEVSQSGNIQSHTLNISGGSKEVRYYVSGDYLKQKGVVKGYQFHRASIRSNIDATITSYLTAGVNLYLATDNFDGGRASLTGALVTSPYGTFKRPDGSYELYPMFSETLYLNPLLGLQKSNNDRSKSATVSTYAELKPLFLKGLSYRVNASYNYVPKSTQYYAGRLAGNLIWSASVGNSETNFWVIENILNYDKNIGRHHVDATALYSAQETQYFQTGASVNDFINDVLTFNNLSSGASPSASSFSNKNDLLSQMLRVNYSFDSRYLFTATARRDGYSAFGANTSKYGLFPSVAVGWNISNEKFMKSIAFINFLKLRGSYGISGNNSIGTNSTVSQFSTVRLPVNGTTVTGVVANTLGNGDLTWESTYGTNVGLEFAVLNQRINGTIEAYSTKTKDLVLNRSLPIITGYNRVLDNLGKVSNTGFELLLRTQNVVSKNFGWESSLNFSTNKNKILDLYGDGKSDIGNQWFIGKPVNVVYDYKLVGVWQVGENPGSQDPTAKPGDLKFADVNGSKSITAEDRVILGQTRPKWTGGLTNTFHYRNFHLSVFIQTAQGITKNNSLLDFRDQGGRQNLPADIPYWTATNGNNSRPSLAYVNARGYGYAQDASYTRIKDATLSFTAPKGLLDRTKLGGLTIYLSGRNLATFTKWTGWDPEEDYNRDPFGVTNSYPLVRSFILGANVTLR